MDNKLSELSKPVAWAFKDANDVEHASIIKKANLYGRHDFQPLYSQEYVSALQHESAVNWEAATSLVAESEELKRALEASKKSNAFLKEQLAQLANFNPDWDMLEACRESWREVAAALKEAEATLEAKDKRIAELEAIRADASQVFKEIGNELGCNPDNESIMMAIDNLKQDNTALRDQRAGLAREANRLETHNARLREWNAGLAQESSELQAKLAAPVRLPNKNDDEFWFDGVFQVARFDRAVERAISAAGFKFVGDEQSCQHIQS